MKKETEAKVILFTTSKEKKPLPTTQGCVAVFIGIEWHRG